MSALILFLLALSVWLLSFSATWLVLRLLTKQQVMDIPNERSNHKRPTPRGGGVAVLLAIVGGVVALFVLQSEMPDSFIPVCAVTFGIAAFLFMDDLRGLSIKWRFLAQITAVIVGLMLFPAEGYVFQGMLPSWADKILTGILWVGFINLYNFMDGIDGITSMETIAIAIGIAFIAVISPHFDAEYATISMVFVAAILGFLLWNWHPARIFLGDVGSVGLGYIIGWLLLQLAISGHWVAALVLPGYYLADGGITLLKRILNKEKFWQAHSKHYYQQAVRGGRSPQAVVASITLVNILLIAGAVTSLYWTGVVESIVLLASNVGAVLLLLWYLSKPSTLNKELK